MKLKYYFIMFLAVFNAFFAGFAIGFNSREAAVVDVFSSQQESIGQMHDKVLGRDSLVPNLRNR